MQMVVSPIQWGNMTLVLDQPSFEEGYTHGRQYYFEDVDEAEEIDGIHLALTASLLLRLIAMPDQRGCYQLEDGCDSSAFERGVEQLLGILVGYLSGPLHPETQEEQTTRFAECVVIEE